jgi:alpha-1,2-glucosyltransferase
LAYANHLGRVNRRSGNSFLNDLYTVFLGVLALFMRQTNVFWVVVYMGGLEAVQAVKDSRGLAQQDTTVAGTWTDQLQVFVQKAASGDVYDPAVEKAWPDDILASVVSLGLGAVSNLVSVLRRVYPQIVTMALFAGFVAWNGGVVLGDKSNHVATIHLAQMLYIWPLFAFFSAPLFLPQVLSVLQMVIAPPKNETSAKSKQDSGSSNYFYLRVALSVILAAGGVVVALLIVHFNTIVHPFTLADNRHYMFYVFRYSILRGTVLRLALAPVYVACAILSWTALYATTSLSSPTDSSTKTKKSAVAATAPSSTSTTTSNTLILILTTALSLVTAPLVEPRYFILPWVFWRLRVPQRPQRQGLLDWALLLETAWFLAVNTATMYVFVTRPFYWKTVADDGTTTLLDEGRVQRFMW